MADMTQGERITKIETQTDYIKKDVSEIKTMLERYIEKDFMTNETAKRTFAPIWVEGMVKALVVLFVGTAVGTIIKMFGI